MALHLRGSCPRPWCEAHSPPTPALRHLPGSQRRHFGRYSRGNPKAHRLPSEAGSALYVVSIVWRVMLRDTRAAVAFHRWGGAGVRQLSSKLLAPLPHEGLAWMPVPASADDTGVLGTTSSHLTANASAVEAHSGKKGGHLRGESGLRGSSSSEQLWLPQLRGIQKTVACLEQALDAPRLVLKTHAAPTADRPAGAASQPAGSAAAGEGKGARLALSWRDYFLELEMLARCRGHLWHHHSHDQPSTEAELVGVSFDYFILAASCIAFILWTPAATAILQLFSCIRIEPQPELSPFPSGFEGMWLLQDVSERCYEGRHLRYALGVGIPGAPSAGRRGCAPHLGPPLMRLLLACGVDAYIRASPS